MLEQSKNAMWPQQRAADIYVVDLLDDIKRRVGDDLDDLIAPLVTDPRFLRLLQYVLQHLSEPLPASKAAALVSVEKKYFSKFFGKQTGFNFGWWNRELRMRLAKGLFRQRGRTVHTVAQTVGYRNLTTFERAFKKSTGGVGPRDYHRSHAPALKSKEA
jgi:transcriptional regulator GlxA family with amidase domain